MNLHELLKPFTDISDRTLLLKSKHAVIDALKRYGNGYMERNLENASRYHQRQQRQMLEELKLRGILESGTASDAELHLRPITASEKITIPTNLPYGTLSLAEIKTLIALYKEAKYSRAPYFTYEGTLAELAEAAHLNRVAALRALKSLAAKEWFLTAQKIRVKGKRGVAGTRVTLLDNQSGIRLHDLAMAHIEARNQLTAPVIYKLALQGYDPRYQLEHINGYVSGMTVLCPFCDKPEKTFRFTCTETEDRWHCFKCNRSGDSMRLASGPLWWKIGKSEPFKIIAAKILEATRQKDEQGEQKDQ